jgi:PAS domain S-box-containing protein
MEFAQNLRYKVFELFKWLPSVAYVVPSIVSDKALALFSMQCQEQNIAAQDGQRLQRLLQAVVVANLDGVILTVNKYANQLFGYGDGELIGCNVELLMPEAYREHHRSQLQRFGIHKVFVTNMTNRTVGGLHKTGREFPLALSLTYLEEPTPRIAALMEEVQEVSFLVKSTQDGAITFVRGGCDIFTSVTCD